MTDADIRVIADIGLGGMALALYLKLNALVKVLTVTMADHGARLDSHGERLNKLESRW